MPTYMYKAATKSGLVVRNKVEASSKQSLIKALKGNNLLPIDVEQLTYRTNKKKTKKKNITDIQEIMKNVNTTQLGQPKQKTLSTKERINLYLKKSEKITQRDLVIFTQNFLKIFLPVLKQVNICIQQWNIIQIYFHIYIQI